MDCALCREDGGEVFYRDDSLRVILPDEPEYPGFTRVVWNAHCAEMTDLSTAQQQTLMMMVFRVESLMRQAMSPSKVNLASLGNQVPHLHWHVIARYEDDPTFPGPVWTDAVRASDAGRLSGQLERYRVALNSLRVA